MAGRPIAEEKQSAKTVSQGGGPLRALTILIAAAIFAADLALPLGVAGAVLYVAVVLLAARLPWAREVLIFALGCSLLTMLGLFLSPPAGGAEAWKVLANRGLALGVIWATAILRLQHRRAEHSAAESRARSAAMLDSAEDGIIMIDESGTIESANPAALRLFGYEASELIGQNIRVLMSSAFADEYDRYLEDYLRTGQKETFASSREVVGLKNDNSTFPMDLALSEVRAGERRGFMGIARDLTERKQLEEQLLQAQRMEAVARLAGGVAHDFNSLLGAIQGSSELLIDHLSEDDALQRSAQRILQAAERGAALTQQLLAFSRRQVIQPEVIDLDATIRGIRDLIAHLIGDDVEIELRLGASPHSARLGPGHVDQVVMNLVVNARDAMPAGGRLVIETTVADLKEKEAERLGLSTAPHLVLSVEDTGEGMDAETQKQIFEPFFTTKRPGEGTGLGLSVVYGIVKLNGGEIEVASSPGAGARFRIYLPVTDEAPVEHSASPPVAVAHTGSETILVVEDDELLRALVCDVLEMSGYSVRTAASTEEALREAEKCPIDLVITDVVMPGMTGVDLAERIREHHPRLQILFMSGYTDRALVARGVLEPGVNFISKPFSNRALTALAREILSSADAT